MTNEIASFAEKADAGEVMSEDVLGLIENFPDLIKETDVLGTAFSELSLSGAVKDASALQALLESIAQTKLADILKENDIDDQYVVQGLANTLDFSHTDKDEAERTLSHLRDMGVNVDGIDIDTEEGLDILGNIKFVVDNADVTNISDVVENATNNGATKGLNKAITQVKNLSDDMSALSGMSDSLLSGSFSTEDATSLIETGLSKLKLSGK